MGRIVIASYKPKPHMNNELKALVKNHHKVLHSEGLVTDRQPILMEAKDGTIVEVFEWLSQEAIDLAHTNLKVQEMWLKFDEICEFIPVGEVEESSHLFSEFAALNLE